MCSIDSTTRVSSNLCEERSYLKSNAPNVFETALAMTEFLDRQALRIRNSMKPTQIPGTIDYSCLNNHTVHGTRLFQTLVEQSIKLEKLATLKNELKLLKGSIGVIIGMKDSLQLLNEEVSNSNINCSRLSRCCVLEIPQRGIPCNKKDDYTTLKSITEDDEIVEFLAVLVTQENIAQI